MVHPNTSTTTRANHNRSPRIPGPFSLTIHQRDATATTRPVSQPGGLRCQHRAKTARLWPLNTCAVQSITLQAFASDEDDLAVADQAPAL